MVNFTLFGTKKHHINFKVKFGFPIGQIRMLSLTFVNFRPIRHMKSNYFCFLVNFDLVKPSKPENQNKIWPTKKSDGCYELYMDIKESMCLYTRNDTKNINPDKFRKNTKMIQLIWTSVATSVWKFEINYLNTYIMIAAKEWGPEGNFTLLVPNSSEIS